VELIEPRSIARTTMKARLYSLAATASTLAVLVELLEAGRKWG
jgi:hypothetical protein